jgi:serine/threonine protein kinase
MDFIDREQLIAAMNAWVMEKSKRLDQILLEQNSLGEDTRALLVAMVEKHLELHGGDAEKSLAAVSSLGSVRDELRDLGDPQVDATLAGVPAERECIDPLLSETIAAGTPSSDGQRFHILRPHAKGGLGEVSVAHDAELHREVALKEIQQRYAHDVNNRARFVMEAEITGSLEHPGIVPVYGLGQYADGRPFYAMRFIRGDSLQEATDVFHQAEQRNGSGSSLELRKLLGRFVDVCQAVEYAHSRGVLHRDLKPGNIMLGKYGETLVVDWGLAKAVGRQEQQQTAGETTLQPSSASGSAPTQMGRAIGTPAYMSPEQAAGHLDELGPASDVYSLGATLYYLLTGQASIQSDDLGTILRKVEAGDFPKPREIRPATPKPLEAICLKAMSLQAKQRYESPQQLALEIERWLADEPVSAYRDPLLTQGRRWMRLHPCWLRGCRPLRSSRC